MKKEENFEEMKKIKEKEALLVKRDGTVLLVKEKKGIKLVNLDLSDGVLLNEPVKMEIEI